MAKARIKKKKTYKKLGYFHRKFKSVHDGGGERNKSFISTVRAAADKS